MPEGEVPDDANEHCPGVGSENAGKADACQGCPNQSICSTAPKGPDPDIPIIQERMKDIKHKILVLSGKGGVGKSTFSSQLAFALAIDPDVEVGLVDVDVCGPSGAVMCGVEDQAMSHTRADGLISPIYTSQNISLVSVACLLQENDTPLIWRGNKKNQLIKQFLRDIDWGELDFLIVDTPPGTSDEHLSIVDYLKPAHIDGAIVITTPQEVSLADVRKEINFCKKVNIPILGIVENMSGFVCPNCQGESLIFPPTTGGAKKLSADLKIPLLGSIPLDPRIGKCSDEGKSFLETHPGTHAAKSYQQIIENLLAQLLNK